ncbi:hypothetical protein Poli38472_004212 [Pythium oligandrum]|uniref:Thioredoxin domain-containing protein n=1 Tax=Pythium oligandrum TaxID=41045 RepID=A0A8K1CPV2_PYTOL|nr:hypothetical protein Poli38472_004212 [Pythium oligandrum]|eukprot:TMW66447.1 hypothetical protein Poli38472_004212 [Pythium oligandrum]
MVASKRGAALHALVLGGLGAWLTFAFTNPLGQSWTLKDYVFVLAVIVAVFYNRLSTMKYENLMQIEHRKKRQSVQSLQRIEWVHGLPRQIELNKGTWCKDSRAALKTMEKLRQVFTHGGVQFVALTQEKREELAAYEEKGRGASDFQPLEEFSFSIAIEDGLMSKEYLVRFDIYHIPHMFIIGKDKVIHWYGKPSEKGIEGRIRDCLLADNTPLNAESFAVADVHMKKVN